MSIGVKRAMSRSGQAQTAAQEVIAGDRGAASAARAARTRPGPRAAPTSQSAAPPEASINMNELRELIDSDH